MCKDFSSMVLICLGVIIRPETAVLVIALRQAEAGNEESTISILEPDFGLAAVVCVPEYDLSCRLF